MQDHGKFNDFQQCFFNFRQELWINDLVIGNILLIISVYLLVALVYHHVKIEKPLKSKFFQLTLEKKYRVLSKYTCIVIGVFSVLRCVGIIGVDFAEMNAVLSNMSVQQPTHHAEIVCKVLPRVSASAVFFGNVFVYVFLWFRQSIFYVHSTLKVLYNNKLKIFSCSVLLLYLFLAISLFVAHFILVQKALNKAGACLIQIVADLFTLYLQLLTTWNILSIVMQISLLGLFMYPLLKQSSWNTNRQGMQNHRMLRLIKKSVILASVCLVTDIFIVVSFNLVFDTDSNNPSFIYALNLVINHLVIIVCFGFWKKLVWPW